MRMWRQGLVVGISLYFSALVFEAEFLMNLQIQLDWLVRKSLRSFCLCLTPGITVACYTSRVLGTEHPAWCFFWALGIRLRSSCFCGNWATISALVISVIKQSVFGQCSLRNWRNLISDILQIEMVISYPRYLKQMFYLVSFLDFGISHTNCKAFQKFRFGCYCVSLGKKSLKVALYEKVGLAVGCVCL